MIKQELAKTRSFRMKVQSLLANDSYADMRDILEFTLKVYEERIALLRQLDNYQTKETKARRVNCYYNLSDNLD